MIGDLYRYEWFRSLLDFALPPLCLGCGEYTDDPYAVCDRCRTRFNVFENPFCLSCFNQIQGEDVCSVCRDECLPLYAYADYAPPLKDIVIHFKFKGITHPAELFARSLTDAFGARIAGLRADYLVPVPLHRMRERERGYNQSDLIARHLGNNLHIEVRSDIIERVRHRKPQARLDRRHRASNIKDVFETIVEGDGTKRVLLVDDVVTSGLTVLEASQAMQAGGYDVVGVIAIAHEP